MKTVVLFIFCIVALKSSAQKEINGVVYASDGWPLSGVVLSQPEADKFYYTDGEGKFSMPLDSLFRDEIIFNIPDYQEIIIPNLDRRKGELVVVMFPVLNFKINPGDSIGYIGHPKAYPELSADFFIDVIKPDFENFRPFLGEEITEYLNNKVGFLGIEMGFRRKRQYLGLNYGLLFADAATEDETERLETINYSLGVKWGYRILNKQKFYIQPNVCVRMLRYRIIRRQNDAVSLPDFLANPDLDIRFRQGAATFGIEFGFKIPRKKDTATNNKVDQSFGVYFNYFQKINRFPDYGGLRTVIDTKERINFGKLNFGVFYRLGQ